MQFAQFIHQDSLEDYRGALRMRKNKNKVDLKFAFKHGILLCQKVHVQRINELKRLPLYINREKHVPDCVVFIKYIKIDCVFKSLN